MRKEVRKILNQQEEMILEKYRNGSDIGYIVEKLNTTYELVKKTIITFKENNRLKKSFTEEFKTLIAERDMSGVSRRKIARELEINANTVKNACIMFGQVGKEKASSESEFTRIELEEFDLTTCPTCQSKKVNVVDENTTFCKSCGSEHIHHKIFEVLKEEGKKKAKKFVGAYALKINWEYIE